MSASNTTQYRGTFLVFGAPTLAGLWFISSYAFTYLSSEPNRFGIYAPRRDWLTAHIVGGIAALLLGPAQHWLGLNRRTRILHRILGPAYVVGVAVAGTAAFYLAFHTDFRWVFGLGFSAMSAAWLVATALATLAILRRRAEQHREWMIRSYVLTFGFVTFRLCYLVLDAARIGTIVERMTAAAWLGWTVPLIIAEAVMQGRKIFAGGVTATTVPDAKAHSAVPVPKAFDLQGSESSYLRQP